MKLKTTLTTLLAMGTLCLSMFSSANAQTYVWSLGGVHGPSGLSGYSPADFGPFRDNRGAQMLQMIHGGGTADVGTGPYQVAHLDTLTYRKMVVTPNVQSWHGILAPGSNQKGTAWYHAFYVFVTSGTFVPAQVDIHTQSLTWNGTGHVLGGGIDFHTSLQTVHSARIRMSAGLDGQMGTIDDTPSSTQDGDLPSTGFAFIGPHVAYFPFGNGTTQEQIDDTVGWMQVNKLKIRYTVTVPATTGTQVFVFEVGPEQEGGEAVTDLEYNQTLKTLTWTSNGKTSFIQKSPDLATWSSGPMLWLPPGQTFVMPTTEQTSGEPRHFYRVVTP